MENLEQISGQHENECDICHRYSVGAWYQDMETGVEWFVCNECTEKGE